MSVKIYEPIKKPDIEAIRWSCTDTDCVDCLVENIKIQYRDYLKED